MEDNVNLLYVQMGRLARAVRSAIHSGETELPLQVCVFLDEAVRKPGAIAEIENAVAISFVEAQELRASRAGRVPLRRMPMRVRQILLD